MNQTQKVETVLRRLVPPAKQLLILSKALWFSRLFFPSHFPWLTRFSSHPSQLFFTCPLSWPLVNYALSVVAYYSFSNPAVLSLILGSNPTLQTISDRRFEHYTQILKGFGVMFYFDLCVPLLLVHGSRSASLVALLAVSFSAALQKSSCMEKQIKLIMTWWEDNDDCKNAIIRMKERDEDVRKLMLLKAREYEMEEEEARKEMVRKLMEKWKKEKEKHKGYRRKWEVEKEEKAVLNGKLSAATQWAEQCQTKLQNYEEQGRKWEDERNELMAKLSAAEESSALYQQLLHDF